MNRRQAMLSLATSAAHAQSARAAKRPNIVFILTDDHPVSALGCYGNRILKTPNMDRIATEGFRFTNAFVTNSLCAPSRASILTGTYSHINGIFGNSETVPEYLKKGITTYPQLLKQAGYRTAVVGKWHLTAEPQGFDYSCVLPGQGVYHDPVFFENGKKTAIPGYVTDIITEKSLAWLKAAPRDQPFCLLYQHKGPHRPFTPPARHQKMFDGIDLPHPRTYNDNYATRRIAQQAEDMRFDISLAPDYSDLPRNLTAAQKREWIYQRFVKDHWRTTYAIDEGIGQVLNYLDRESLAEDTVVIYTSDNGFYLGERGWYDKRFMYEPSLRVPLMIRYPRLGLRGRVENRMALNIDFAPTILELAGVPVPSAMQGASLKPLLEQRRVEWRKSMLYTYYENSWAQRKAAGFDPAKPALDRYGTAHRIPPHRGVRTERHKLIEYYGEGDYWEFFDLVKDPDEQHNRYEDSAYAAVVKSLKEELLRLRKQYGN